MPLETGSFINDLTPSNPPGSDPAGQGDDHIRLLKTTVQGTFPQMGAVFGQVRRQDTALSISSIWNTNHFICSASATATVVLTLPPAGSITAGFYVDITTIGTGTVSLLPSGAASINGGVSLSVPRLNTARAYFIGGTAWLADTVPHAQGGTSVISNLAVDGTLSVSGATVLAGSLSVSGAATFGGAVTISGAATFAGTVSISGAATFKTTMSISGAATFGGTVTISGSCLMGSNLNVSGAVVLGSTVAITGNLTASGTTTLSGTVVLTNGQLKFPAAQNQSNDANTLDDYEEGTFTPTLTFATPGDLAVTYTTRIGQYTKIGDNMTVNMRIATSAFTHSTAAGALRITGLPAAILSSAGSIIGGWVADLTGVAVTAGRTQVVMQAAAAATLADFVTLSLTTGGGFNIAPAEAASGSNKVVIVNFNYKTST